MPRRLGAAAVTLLALAALGTGLASAGQPSSVLAAGPAAAQAMAANAADHDDPADHSWNASDVVAVTLNGTSASGSGTGLSISGSNITISAAGTYQFTGTLTNGRIVVNSTGSGIVRLILNGATITSTSTAPIAVTAAAEVMVVLNAGTTNRLTDPATYTTAVNPTATLSSAANLTITGTGSLTVTGNAADGIASDKGLVVGSGTIAVTAKDDGIRGQDYVYVTGGTFTVTSAGDAVKADNGGDTTRGYVYLAGGSLNLTATAGDAVTATTDVIVAGGTLTAKSGGGSSTAPGSASTKGLKADVLVVVSDGTLTLDSSDDTVNSNGNVTIDGGSITAATGDDAVHADVNIAVAGGTVTVTKSYEGLEGLKVLVSGGTTTVTASDDAVNAADETVPEMQNAPNATITVSGGVIAVAGGTDGLDSNGSLTISGGVVLAGGSPTRGGGEGGLDSNGALNLTGGTVVSIGASATTSTLPSSGQGWVYYNFGSSQAANTVLHLANSAGTQLISVAIPRATTQVVFSASTITRGQSYQISRGGSVSGTAAGGGIFTGGTLSGTSVATVTAGSR
jgi:hypothetical protein